MNPRVLLAWSAAALVMVLATPHPLYRGLILLIALNLLAGRARPGSLSRRAVGALLGATALTVAIVFGLTHTGNHVIAGIPAIIPVAGGPLTLEGLAQGVVLGLGLLAAAAVMAPLALVLESHQLVDALPRSLQRTAVALAASLNLVPGVARSFRAVRDAQVARGWRPAGMRSLAGLVVPVTLTTLEGSFQLAEAMEARGYGSGPRTTYVPSPWTRLDIVAAVAVAAGLALFLAGLLRGPGWSPYPVISVPPLDLSMLLGCLLLSVAAFGPRR